MGESGGTALPDGDAAHRSRREVTPEAAQLLREQAARLFRMAPLVERDRAFGLCRAGVAEDGGG